MVLLFKLVAMTPNGTAYEQQELSSTDKEALDKRVAVAKSAGWIVRGVRHSSDGVHVATMVRQQIIAGVSAISSWQHCSQKAAY